MSKDMFEMEPEELKRINSLMTAVDRARSRDNADIEVAEVFEYRNVQCVIAKIKVDLSEQDITPESEHVHHNGYMQIAESENDIEKKIKGPAGYDITYTRYNHITDSTELTYSGTMDTLDINGYYLGFDTAHDANFRNPKTQTKSAVKEQLKQTVDEFMDSELQSQNPLKNSD